MSILRDTGDSSPTINAFKNTLANPPQNSPNVGRITGGCNDAPQDPVFQFIPLSGQFFNQNIVFGSPVKFIALQFDQSILDVAAWFHWQPFSDFDKDMDTPQAVQAPGIFVGGGCLSSFSTPDVVPTLVDAFSPQRKRMPYIKLCKPVDKMFFTGWGEPLDGSAAVDVDFSIIAGLEVDEMFAYMIGGV